MPKRKVEHYTITDIIKTANIEERDKKIQSKLNDYSRENILLCIEIANDKYPIQRPSDATSFCIILDMIVEYMHLSIENEEDISLDTFMKYLAKLPVVGEESELVVEIDEYISNNNDAETEPLASLRDQLQQVFTKTNLLDTYKFIYYSVITDGAYYNDKCEFAEKFANKMTELYIGNLFSDITNEDVQHQTSQTTPKDVKKFLTSNSPKSINKYLDKHIIGQEEAKREVSSAVYYYIKKLISNDKEVKSNNLILAGPSGCGKTEIMRVLKDYLPIPVIIYDVSSITVSGFKGDDKDNILKMIDYYGGVGVVYLDEFDKICVPSYDSNGTNFNANTQGQLLAMIEGNEMALENGHVVDTSNCLFIAGGSFEGMKISDKKEKKANIGFGSTAKSEIEENSSTYKVTIEDILKYGLRTELAGRFNSVVTMRQLKDDELCIVANRIVRDYERMIGKSIKFDKDTLVKEIKGNQLGCRYIKQILNKALGGVMYEAPEHPESKEVKVTKDENGFKANFI